jgi:hypothetical protein
LGVLFVNKFEGPVQKYLLAGFAKQLKAGGKLVAHKQLKKLLSSGIGCFWSGHHEEQHRETG